MQGRTGIASWVFPTKGNILLLGAAGVTSKLALRTISSITEAPIAGTVLVIAGVVLISR